MSKLFAFAALLAVAFAAPAPEAKAEPKAQFVAYNAPYVAASPVAYSTGLTYAAAPVAYGAYPAYSAYSAPYYTLL